MTAALALSGQGALRRSGDVASSVSVDLPGNHATGATGASSGVFPADLHAIRRCLPDRWMAFLRAHFQGPVHVALFFSVDDRTSRDWWNGKHGVNAAPVILAMVRIPGAVAELLEIAA